MQSQQRSLATNTAFHANTRASSAGTHRILPRNEPREIIMGPSLESSRPIMAPSLASKRASTRFSTYSTAPSVANTVKTSLSSASAQQEIKDIEEGLEKLENKKLASQRFVPTKEKSENLSKLALGAKLERALGRRMGGQDAVMRDRRSKSGDTTTVLDEKSAVA